MYIYLYVDLNSVNLSHFLITKDRYFVIERIFEFDDVPLVKYTEDDYYETTEKQCVDSHAEIIAVFDNLDEAVSFRDMERTKYLEHIAEYKLSEEYSYIRYYIYVYNESEEEFEVIENV